MNVPEPIRSNRFDCPYPSQARCDKWQGWRFAEGHAAHERQRALIYSRIRENMLDPAETDVTRGARQQDVLNAVAQKFTSLGVLEQDAVLGRLVRQAADDRPDGGAARPARLGEVPRVERRARCTAGSAAISAAAAPAARARTIRRRSRCSSGGRRRSRRPTRSGPGCVDGPRAASKVAAWASSRSRSSGSSRASSRER